MTAMTDDEDSTTWTVDDGDDCARRTTSLGRGRKIEQGDGVEEKNCREKGEEAGDRRKEKKMKKRQQKEMQRSGENKKG
ncbi:unnamed protein product, partial [Prunus brigantina]